MLGICFFTQGGGCTGESIWEGDKGIKGDFFGKSLNAENLKTEIRGMKTLISVDLVAVCRLNGTAPLPCCGFRSAAGSSSERPVLLLSGLIENQDAAIFQMDFLGSPCWTLVEAIRVRIRWIA
jgi:hypothetical protein